MIRYLGTRLVRTLKKGVIEAGSRPPYETVTAPKCVVSEAQNGCLERLPMPENICYPGD
jgi:hypothetical protein